MHTLISSSNDQHTPFFFIGKRPYAEKKPSWKTFPASQVEVEITLRPFSSSTFCITFRWSYSRGQTSGSKGLRIWGHCKIICTICIFHFQTDVRFYGKPLHREELLFWKRPDAGLKNLRKKTDSKDVFRWGDLFVHFLQLHLSEHHLNLWVFFHLDFHA